MNKSLALRPNNESVYYDLGLVYWKMGDDANAIASYDKAVQINPRFADGYFDLGEFYLAKGDKQKAKYNYDKAKTLYKELGREEDVKYIDEQLKKL
jgi:tetratricopeptide (TPR) repeat protein